MAGSSRVVVALRAGLAAGLAVGLAGGALTGLRLAQAPGVLHPPAAPAALVPVATGALLAALAGWAGLVCGGALVAFRRPFPIALALALTAVTALPIALVANVRHLPEFASRTSLAGNAALALGAVLVAALLVALAGRLVGERPPPRLRVLLPLLALLSVAAIGLRMERPAPPAESRFGPGQAAPGAPRTLLLITIDALRADHLGSYGYRRETSPVIDSLAATGTRYERCIAAAPNTHPSLAAMLTGAPLSAFDHLALNDFLPAGAETLAGAARAAGYRTLAVVANPWLKREMGFAQGFDRFDDESAMIAGADRVTDAGLALLEAEDGPAFLWLHYLDPHHPYTPPYPYDRRFASAEAEADALQRRPDMQHALVSAALGQSPLGEAAWRRLEDLYDGEILFADSEIGRLLARLHELGRMDSTRIVVTADHGEEWRDHGGVLHGHTLHRELTRLPLVVWESGAAVARGRSESRLIAATEIGRLVLGAAPRLDLPVVSEKLHETERLSPPLVALRSAEATLIAPSWRPGGGGFEPRRVRHALRELLLFLPVARDVRVYDAADAAEQHDLALTQPATRARLERELRLRFRAGRVRWGSDAAPDEGTLEQLRGLGYLNP